MQLLAYVDVSKFSQLIEASVYLEFVYFWECIIYSQKYSDLDVREIAIKHLSMVVLLKFDSAPTSASQLWQTSLQALQTSWSSEAFKHHTIWPCQNQHVLLCGNKVGIT